MKACIGAICAMMLLWTLPAAAAPAQPYSFATVAPVTGTLQPGTPHRLALPKDFIAASRDDLADVRLVDDTGAEIPYVVYEDMVPAVIPRTFRFEVAAFDTGDGVESFTLTCPEDAVPFRRIIFDTPARDFKKNVAVSRWDDEDQQWVMVTTDTIFDFSSRVDLRRDYIDLPRMEPGKLRVDLQTDTETPADPGLSVTYRGLQLTDGTTARPAFRIDAVMGSTARFDDSRVILDRAVYVKPATRQQPDGSTLVDLGRINLPLYEFMLLVDTPYFHRRVQVQTAATDNPAAFRTVANGEIYAMPGMTRKQTVVAAQQGQSPWVRLRIDNGDSPALTIRSVTLRWVRRNLYFIPEAGHSYRLLTGNADLQRPAYDVARIITPRAEKLASLPALSAGIPAPNPVYNPEQVEKDRIGTRDWFEHWAFTTVIILLAAIMGLWIGVLLRRGTGDRDSSGRF